MSAKNAKTALAYCRMWHTIDANNKVVGRLAVQIATLLQGKHKPIFDRAADTGDYVVVTNAEKVQFTGSKWTDKKYYKHTGYPGHLKIHQAFQLAERDPTAILRKAVSGMLPKNRIRRERMQRLKIVVGPVNPYSQNTCRSYVPPNFGIQRFST